MSKTAQSGSILYDVTAVKNYYQILISKYAFIHPQHHFLFNFRGKVSSKFFFFAVTPTTAGDKAAKIGRKVILRLVEYTWAHFK